ncbi:MAG: hypothetical protein RMJ88_07480 [Thermogemmata sp.]|nr:hypothetical protein [Thermogemmata sp.]
MASLVHKLPIPYECLPTEMNERQRVLREYFCDLIPEIKESDHGWIVELRWPDHADFFVDPLIPHHLDWWRAGMSLVNIRREVYCSAHGLIALDDAWTLYGWSKWLTNNFSISQPPCEVVIIHVDYHKDMMCPRIIQTACGYEDALTGNCFSIFDPPSVKSAILSGAIGIGSYIAPVVHELPKVHIRHIRPAIIGDKDNSEGHILRNTEPDTLLRPNKPRLSMKITPTLPQAVRCQSDECSGSYRVSSDYSYAFSDLPDCPVLLHIDMDYFNNRYDRDSEWSKRPRKHDPTLEQLLYEIDAMFNALTNSGISQRLTNVTVALSPGFFPSEFWRASMERLESHLLRFELPFGRSKYEGGSGDQLEQ